MKFNNIFEIINLINTVFFISNIKLIDLAIFLSNYIKILNFYNIFN